MGAAPKRETPAREGDAAGAVDRQADDHHDRSTDAAAGNVPSDTCGAARFYSEQGFRILRMINKETPLVEGFGAENPDFTCRPDTFYPHELVGILCGPCPAFGEDWLLCVDRDGPFTHEDLEAHTGPLPATLTSHGGRHAWYRVCPSAKRDRLMQWTDVFRTKAATGGGAVDLKWAGGYACELGDWDGQFDVACIATLPESALDAILVARERPSTTSSRGEEGGPAWLTSHGLDPAKVIDWAIAYLEGEAPPAVQGGKTPGHSSLLVAAGGLLVGYGLDDDTTFDLLRDVYNPRCEPPWESPELETQFQHKIDEINAKGSEAYTSLELARRDELVNSFSNDFRRAGNDNADRSEEPSQPSPIGEAPRAPPAWRLLSSDELLEPLGPVNWLVEGLELAEGAPSVWAGYGFSGKTLAAQDLAVAVATGTPLWGLAVRQGRVLYLDYEQGRRLTSARFQKLLRGRRSVADFAGNLDVGILPPFRLDPKLEDAFTKMCRGYALIVIDSLRAAAPGNLEENSSDIRAPLDMMTRVSEATGAAVVIIHHARKPSKDAAGGSKMSLRGSGAIFDACASVLVFSGEKDRPTKVSHEKARISGMPRDDFELIREDVDTPTGPGLIIRMAGASEPKATGAAEAERTILAVVTANPGCTKTYLNESIGGKKATLVATVDHMVRNGLLWEVTGANNSSRLFVQAPRDIVLRVLSDVSPTALTLAELAERTQLPPQKVRTTLVTLSQDGLVLDNGREGVEQRWQLFRP
jgi:hypothetical protein